MPAISNIRTGFSDEHMSESLLFDIDGTEYREVVSVWENGFEMPDIRESYDEYLPGPLTLLDEDFDPDTIRKIHEQLSEWIKENEGSYESGSDGSKVTELWHGLFKSNGFEIVLSEDAAKELDVRDRSVSLVFNDDYAVHWMRDSDGEFEEVEVAPGSPDDHARAIAWAIRNPEDVVLEAIRNRNEDQVAEAA